MNIEGTQAIYFNRNKKSKKKVKKSKKK